MHQTVGRGNLTAFEMISIALFGAVFATATGGAMVSIERTLGWSRQLRVTPLSPTAYIVIKMLTSLCLAAGAVGAVYLVGAATNQAAMPAVSVGHHRDLRVDRITAVLRPRTVHRVSASLRERHADHLARPDCVRIAGGLFIPVSQFPHTYAILAKFTPLYGLNELVHYPLVGSHFEWVWVLNLAVWLAVFVLGAVWQLRRDTARV